MDNNRVQFSMETMEKTLVCIVEQYTAIANSAPMPLQSRALPEFARLVKGHTGDINIEVDHERLTSKEMREMIEEEIRKSLSGFLNEV